MLFKKVIYRFQKRENDNFSYSTMILNILITKFSKKVIIDTIYIYGI